MSVMGEVEGAVLGYILVVGLSVLSCPPRNDLPSEEDKERARNRIMALVVNFIVGMC